MSKFTSNDICKLQVGVSFEIPYLMTNAERHTLSQQLSRVRKQYVGANFRCSTKPQLNSDGNETGYYKVIIERLSFGIDPKGNLEPAIDGVPCDGK